MSREADLGRARELFDNGAWAAAYDACRAADARAPLGAEDLEGLAVAAYLTGHDREACDAWSRAHQRHLRDGQTEPAVRCVMWLGIVHLLLGQTAQARGWLARARTIAPEPDAGSLERAYLDQAAGLEELFGGAPDSAARLLDAAARTARQHGDTDIAALARLGCGQALVMGGRVADGVAMLDEAMVSVAAGEVAPVATGLIYCAVIETCQELGDLRRAQEWTEALGDWCDSNAELVPYRGQCLVHRAELMTLHGSWNDAIEQARQASRRLSEPVHPALGAAYYQEAELHRLRGETGAADGAYRSAMHAGHSAQPGLALLRLAQRRPAVARAAIERALTEPHFPAGRARLLSARLDVQLAESDTDGARASADALVSLADELGSPPMLDAMASAASAAVLLADAEPRVALRAARRAWTTWRAIDAPYEMARTRVLVALACRGLGDEETAVMELAAARATFASLGAEPDVRRVDSSLGRPEAANALTAREIEVLAQVATGSTNRTIAGKLQISEKTVARHVSNIFAKLDLSSRSAATAYAYEHELL